MRPRTLRFVRAGDTLTVKRWNELIDAVNRSGLSLGEDSGLDAQFTPQGITLRKATSKDIVRMAVTTPIPTGSINSPSDTGRGTIWSWDGTSSEAAQTDVQIFNDFNLSADVPIGTTIKCVIIDGDYWLLASECYTAG